jgi:hypothetical protein
VPKNYFDERIAKSYEAKWPNLHERALIEPVVDILAAGVTPSSLAKLTIVPASSRRGPTIIRRPGRARR